LSTTLKEKRRLKTIEEIFTEIKKHLFEYFNFCSLSIDLHAYSDIFCNGTVNTTIPASGGDSGAPLYTEPTSSECRLYGNLKAISGSYSYFSPISGIKNDLRGTPIVS
jgi:hypothetical protein